MNPEWRKMKRKSGEQGSAAVAFALATFLVIFTIVTVYLFLAKIWWFPPAISDFGEQIDAQFHRTLIITGIAAITAGAGAAAAGKHSDTKPRRPGGNARPFRCAKHRACPRMNDRLRPSSEHPA